MNAGPLVEVEDLVVAHRQGRWLRPAPALRAVDGVSLRLAAGETLALVGESGCGKTTLARALVGLLPVERGTVRFRGEDLRRASARRLRALRRHLQIVFQDPIQSLDPRRTAGEIVAEGLEVHRLPRSRAVVAGLLESVGLPAAAADRLPHEFSGGQRQRIALARALATEPEVLVLDEPLAALDVSVQARILRLLAELRERRRLAYLFISHDLSVVRALAERVAVMRAGRIVEIGPVAEVLERPRHAYTRTLLGSLPRLPGERRPDPALRAPPEEGDDSAGTCLHGT